MNHNDSPTAGLAPVNGATLHYEIAGSGQPLVLVHAGIADSGMWEEQFHALAARFRVLRYDMRGFGRSAPVEGAFSHHEDLRALLDHLGIERAALVGCSKGGSTILDFALAHPDRVAALVPVATTPGGYEYTGEAPPQWDEMVAAFKAGDFERAAELEVEMWVDGPHRAPADVDATVRERIRAMDVIALTNEARALGTEERPERRAIDHLGEIAAPTLVIVGALDDPDLVRASDLLAASIPGARLATLPDAAHFPNMERPDDFNRLLLDFLDALD